MKTNTIELKVGPLLDVDCELYSNVVDYMIAHVQKSFKGVEAHKQLQLALWKSGQEFDCTSGYYYSTFNVLNNRIQCYETHEEVYNWVKNMLAAIEGCQPIPSMEEFEPFNTSYKHQWEGGDDPIDVFGEFPIINIGGQVCGKQVNPKLESWFNS